MADRRIRQVAGIRTEFLFDIAIDLEDRVEFGVGPNGRRVLFGAAGGAFTGPRLSGKVMRRGGDWAVFRADGTMVVDVRLALETNDEALIYMTYGGRWATPEAVRPRMGDPAQRLKIDPGEYYFRTQPLFETNASQYAWLNDVVAVGSGYLIEGGVAYRVFALV